MAKALEPRSGAGPPPCPTCSKLGGAPSVVSIGDYFSYIRCDACKGVWSVPTDSVDPVLRKTAPHRF